MPSRSTLVSETQQLLSGEHADPRAAQAMFLVPVLVELLLRAVLWSRPDAWFGYGSLVVLVASVGSVAIARGLVADRWTIVLPVLDMIALGLYRFSEGTAIGAALAVPAIWLGLQFGRRGVAVTLVTVVVVFAVPTLVLSGFTQEAASRATQVTLMAVVCAGSVAMTAQLWKAQYDQSRISAHRLELAMTDVIEQRRLTRTIVNGVDIGLVALDARGAYDSMNPRHRDFMELAFPEGHAGVAGQAGHVYAGDGVTPLGRDEMPTMRAARGEAFRDYLVWVGERPAERRALAVSSTPYFHVNGDFGGAVLAYHDITELVLASRIKDEFVASVSHEFRTPLTSIIGYVDILLEDAEELPADVRGHLGTVQRNARRLHRLVDDLLSTALQSVTTVLDLAPVSVTDLVNGSAVEAAKAAGRAGLDFEFDPGERAGELVVNGDAERLAQVFDNLFSNAVKYTPDGGSVSASVTRERSDAVVRVRDTGRGISESELDEVFTKFYRSRTVLSEAIPGIGLGLAITKTIVDAHGGHISVASALGAGATFEVRLPLAEPRNHPVLSADS